MGFFSNIGGVFGTVAQATNQTINQTNDTPPPAKEERKPAKSKKKSDKAKSAPPADTEKIDISPVSLEGMSVENLLQRREELKNQIREIDTLVEKILQAIKNQRWFFFQNNGFILMDRRTALIWANLNLFPWHKTSITGFESGSRIDNYFHRNSYKDVKDLISKQNSQQWGRFSDWRIPTPDELWNMIEDKSFPFKLGSEWCINKNGNLAGKNLDNNGANNGISNSTGVYVLPCSSALVPQNFSGTPQEIFNIFKENELIPLFDDEEITQLYRKIFVDKPALLKQLAEVETQIAELQPAQTKLTANFNYKPLLAKYDVAATAKSPIKYFDAVLNVSDEFLDILNEYETAQAETIAAFLKIALKLKAKYTDNPNLTPEENALLAERQKFLATRLELATDEPKRKILAVKAQANHFFTRLEAFNAGDKSISDLAALQAEPRADFELLVENMARIVLDTQRRVDFFAENKNFVASVVNFNARWSDDYKAFKTSLHEELAAACRNDAIEDEIFSAWYDDWQVKRFAIEQRFLPLVEFAIKGNLIDVFDVILGSLHTYRDAVDKFYLNERKNIYQKFAFQAGGDLQEKFETESELYKLAEKLQRDLQEVIFKRDKTEERIFLLRWAEPLLNLPLDEISNFIRDRELNAIAEEVLNQFAELRRQNFEQYLADSKSYGEATQKREKEFNALIFRMRKDLHKS